MDLDGFIAHQFTHGEGTVSTASGGRWAVHSRPMEHSQPQPKL